MVRNVPDELELLEPVVALGHVDIPSRIGGDARGLLELPVARAGAAPLEDERPRGRELLNPIVDGVGHVHVAGRVRGQVERVGELAVPRAGGTPFALEAVACAGQGGEALDGSARALAPALVLTAGAVVVGRVGRQPRDDDVEVDVVRVLPASRTAAQVRLLRARADTAHLRIARGAEVCLVGGVLPPPGCRLACRPPMRVQLGA